MKLSEQLQARGFIHQHTGGSLAELLDVEKRTIYHGIDPSADSAHVGNMVVWCLLRHLAEAGHNIIFLVGGGTGMIGDPKPDSERVLQAEEVTDGNVAKIKAQAERLIGGNNNPVRFVNNKDWLAKEGLLTFLRDIGKHFTINELVKKDAIAKRLGGDTGISYTEFAYPLLQGFDYLVLNRDYGCDLQVGGSDQWGNIISGVELIRRKEQKIVHALTVPLVTDKATGKKFGKSEGNAVWLDPEKTSPYTFYQFWFNTNDASVIDYLKLFTNLSLETISELESKVLAEPAAREAQRSLALAVTTFVHGPKTAELVDQVAKRLFTNNLQEISKSEYDVIVQNAPTYELLTAMNIVEVLVASGLASSNREARTFIEAGAVSLGSEKITSLDFSVVVEKGTLTALQRGKKNFVILY